VIFGLKLAGNAPRAGIILGMVFEEKHTVAFTIK
jgi:hypothetical protein